MAETRDVTYALFRPDGTAETRKIIFELIPGSYDADGLFPQREVRATPDANGEGTVELWPNEGGTIASRYKCTLPSGEVFYFTVPTSAGPFTLSALRELGQTVSDPQFPTLLGLLPMVPVKARGAVGDGVTNDRAALFALDADVAEDGGVLAFTAGSYKVNSDLTFSKGNALYFTPGAVLKPASGVTITIASEVEAGHHQIFDTTAGGHVVFTGPHRRLKARWGGAKGDMKRLYGCVMTVGSNLLQITTPPGLGNGDSYFTAEDVGKAILVLGAGANDDGLDGHRTTIATFIDSHTVTLTANAAATCSGQDGFCGTNDTVGLQAVFDAVPDRPKATTIDFGRGHFVLSGTAIRSKADCGARFALWADGGHTSSEAAAGIMQMDKSKNALEMVTMPNVFSCYNVQLQGCLARTGAGSGLVLGSVGTPLYDSVLEDMWIVGFPTNGLQMIDTRGYRVSRIAIELCTTGVLIEGNDGGVDESYQFTNSRIYGNYTCGIRATKACNLLISGGDFGQNGVYAQTDSSGAIVAESSTTPVRGFSANGCMFYDNFQDIALLGTPGMANDDGVHSGQIVNCQSMNPRRRFLRIAGAQNIDIKGNKVTDSGLNSVAGNVACISIESGSDFFIDGNTVLTRSGTPTNTYGLSVAGGITGLRMGTNKFTGATADVLLSSQPEGTLQFTWNPADIAAGAQHAMQTIVATGAQVGDHVEVSADVDLQGLRLWGYVYAADSIAYTLSNNTAGAVNLGSFTGYLKWRRRWEA